MFGGFISKLFLFQNVSPTKLQKSNFKTLKEITNYVCDFINFNDVGNQL
jgi:hypothetical protein